MSNTKYARFTAATLAVTAALALSGCAGAVQLLNSGDTETSTSTSTTASTPTPAAVPTLPTKEPAPADTSANVADAPDALTADVWVIADDIDTFWESMTHSTFDVDVKTVTGKAKCTDTSDRSALAVTCFAEGNKPEVRWSHDGVARLQQSSTNVAVALVLAHEVGHVVLEATGNGPRDESESPRDERRADCMAGVYLSVSQLDLGMTPDVLWKRAVPAVTEGRSAEETRVIRDRIDTGFRAQGNDPLAWCLTNS